MMLLENVLLHSVTGIYCTYVLLVDEWIIFISLTTTIYMACLTLVGLPPYLEDADMRDGLGSSISLDAAAAVPLISGIVTRGFPTITWSTSLRDSHVDSPPCWWVARPANAIHSANGGLMLGQCRRRWPDIKPTLAECIVLGGRVMAWTRAPPVNKIHWANGGLMSGGVADSAPTLTHHWVGQCTIPAGLWVLDLVI